MQYVLIGYDTAWNILKELANQSLSFVYVDRAGNIQVTRDELGTDRIPESDKIKCTTQIKETNAFSYNLPTMSRTIVNRAKIPYLTLEAGDDGGNQFTFEEKDITYDENGCKKVVLELKNFYPSINEVQRTINDTFMPLNAKSIKCCYNRIEITFNENETATEFTITIQSDNYYKLTENTLQLDNIVSQKRNGIAEFELDSANIYGKEKAEGIANSILSEYADGKSYIETDWFGNPEIYLGSFVDSRSKKEEELTRYEIVSNELTLENGLRFNSKARQN